MLTAYSYAELARIYPQVLELAYRQRDSGLIDCKSDAFFSTLYGDPRWLAFLKKIGISDEQLK